MVDERANDLGCQAVRLSGCERTRFFTAAQGELIPPKPA